MYRIFRAISISTYFLNSLLFNQNDMQNTEHEMLRRSNVGESDLDDVFILVDYFFDRQKSDLIQRYGSIEQLKGYRVV